MTPGPARRPGSSGTYDPGAKQHALGARPGRGRRVRAILFGFLEVRGWLEADAGFEDDGQRILGPGPQREQNTM